MRVRTGYSFRTAFGHLHQVLSRIKEIGWQVAPITDRNSTFGYVRWRKQCAKAGIRPIYGLELAVAEDLNAAKPVVDYWTFISTGNMRTLNDLVGIATGTKAREPMLTYEDACNAHGLIKITGERVRLDLITAYDDLYIGVSPSMPRGLMRRVREEHLPFIAVSDNYYPREKDKELYRITLGKRANTQTYPMHLLSDDEWRAATQFICTAAEQDQAIATRNMLMHRTHAELAVANVFTPQKVKTLRQMCIEGAARTGTNLNDKVYSERLDRELRLIADKKFEDYFYIIADLIQYAKKHMMVGPARGSSCGSLVCYLLDITTIDPIPFNLIFERFIDINRTDLPDIDIDFSDVKRHMVFSYAEEKYGKERVARLGTVSMFQPKSVLKQAGIALRIPQWQINKVTESLIDRSSGDARSLQAVEDTLSDTEAGRAIAAEYPEIKIINGMEGHPNSSSQHAAGIVVTDKPVAEFVAVDARTNTTMCDKKDAEDLGLLKIDALGLTQLGIFEQCARLIGKPAKSGWMEKIPLDDPKAFEVLNKGHFSGIFQFTGISLRTITKQVHIENIEDIISITALARPGPFASGATGQWVKRRIGKERVTYPHQIFEQDLSVTLGTVLYQEQVMTIGRNVGDLSWDDVTALRKAMSKSLGKEYFDQYGNKWKPNAIAKGVPKDVADKVWDDLCAYGAWCLSGDTVLRNPHVNQHSKHKTFTLKELYQAQGHCPGNVNAARRQKLFSWNGTGLVPRANVLVTYSGKKQTYTLHTASGKSLRPTAEHEFLQDDGSYKHLRNLKVGDHVMVPGPKQPTKRKAKTNTGSGAHNWQGEEHFYNGKRGSRTDLKAKYKVCQICRKKPYEETHHIDFNHRNNAPSNLLPVCRTCHKWIHRRAGMVPKAYQKGFSIIKDKIVSIEPYGIEDVYDISMPQDSPNFLAGEIVVHNCFNRSHAVAYGVVSYWCCWLKAHYPVEFAAATLDAESRPANQIQLLRELSYEGVSYKAVDPEHSTDHWTPTKVDGNSMLVGPLTQIKGFGPATVKEIMEARKKKLEIRPVLLKRLANARTEIDSLYPIQDAVTRNYPDLPTQLNIHSKPWQVLDVQCGARGDVMIFAIPRKINLKDENEHVNVLKRGGKVYKGPHISLSMFCYDDTDEIFCKIDRFLFESIGRPVLERGRAGKAMYAIKGTVPRDFRMISIKAIRYLGDIDPDEQMRVITAMAAEQVNEPQEETAE